MKKEDKNRLEYTVALVSDFAECYQLKPKQAFNYLKRFKGLAFLNEHYDVMHTQSFADSVDNLAVVCRRNGGRVG